VFYLKFYVYKSLFLLLSVFVSLTLALNGTAQGAGRVQFADIQRFPQQAEAYLPENPDEPIVSFDVQLIYAEAYLERHFAPWHAEDLSFLGVTPESLAAFHRGTANRSWHSADGNPISRAYINAIVRNGVVNNDARPRRGVMIRPADVRILPYANPVYGSRSSALGTSGLLQLDILQLSTARPGEPLAMFNTSVDLNWVFVATSTVAGWIRTTDAAVVDGAFAETFMSSEMAVITRDNAEVRDPDGELLYSLKLGTVLPVDGGELLLPTRRSRAFADIVRYAPEEGVAQPFPVAFTPRNAVRAIDEMMGEEYGWGGLFGRRDCSALTRDYFALFGVWLPRNSRAQARVGERVQLEELSLTERSRVILDDGVPFATLVQMPGHIMLYIGERDGEPLMFHNIWGVRLANNGRAVVGRAVVTGLRLGEELPNRQPNSLMLNRLAVMSFPMSLSPYLDVQPDISGESQALENDGE